MHRKTLPAKHFFIPIFLLIVALIWGAADIGKSGTYTPFSWGNLLRFKGWVEPVTFAPLHKQPRTLLIEPELIEDLFCLPESSICWAVGRGGFIFHTVDSGRRWQLQTSSTSEKLNDVYFSSTQDGWVVGDNGVILHTSDGGKNWQAQSSSTNGSLSSVYFSSPQVGWVAGSSGIILYTANGGQDWQAQISNTNERLNSIYFTSSQVGWVVGASGTILHTANGGQIWQVQTSNTKEDLNSIHFASSLEGWTVGGNGTILHTRLVGQNWNGLLGQQLWQTQTSNTAEPLESVYFASPKEGWAVGGRGAILHTINAGQSWQTQTSNTNEGLSSVYFTSPQEGWAVGGLGTFLYTTNGGEVWEAQINRATDMPMGIHFSSSRTGWANGLWGGILHSSDAGRYWKAIGSNPRDEINGINFSSPLEAWAIDWEGNIIHSTDGGGSWERKNNNPEGSALTGVHFASPLEGWAVGWSGRIFHSIDGGENWYVQHPAGFPLEDIYFSSTQQGWVVGWDGRILHTANGGKDWEAQASTTSEDLNAVYFSSPQEGWAVSQIGVKAILHTTDAGEHWTRVLSLDQRFYEQLRNKNFGNYYHWPSPLALLLLLISLLWLFITLRTASKNPSDYLSDERGGIADAPVQFLDEDKLGYAPLARGIYKLIRNVDSKPPLAIAVSAPWGQGKSSVMNMLHSLLKNDNAVVQFNAWHYRDDNHILAALIEHIRAQAVPNGISLANLGFRWNLLWRRLLAPYWRWWAVVLPVGWFTAWQMGREFDLEWGAIYANIKQHAHELINPLSVLIGEKLASASPAIGVLLLLFALPLIVKKILAPLKSFTPAGEASLYSAAWNSFKATLQTTRRDWVEDAGIRFQFQQDFSDICHALGNRKLVLLIDDLDRCDPKQIEQIINTLNFLFSNNMPCYVVMALDWGYVRTALGVAYKDMANALHHKIKVPKGESRAEIFAENYLRKIIQLKVELPDVDVVAAFAEQARLASEEANAIPIGKLITKMGYDTLKIFTSIKQVLSVNPIHGIDNAVDRLRQPKKINLWNWAKSAGKFFCFLVKALLIEPIGGRLKRHVVNDAYRLGNLIVTVFFACLFSTLVVVALIAITGNAKINPVSNTELAEAPTVATADAQTSPPETPQTRSAKDTTNSPSMLVLDPQKNSAELLFHLFTIGLGFVGIFWVFWFMRQERDSAEFKQALAVWKLQLSHKVKTPREWRRLENNLRFFIMLARGYDYLPVYKRWQRFVDKIKMRLIAYVESTSYKPPEPFVFDEGIATRLIMADVFRRGKVFEQLKADVESGSDPRGQLALDWLENSGHTIDEKLTEFFERFMDRNDEDAANQVKRWLHLHSFKLQLPYKIE